MTRFGLFPGVLEGLESSWKLVGTISTYPGTYKCPESGVIAKNPPGGIFCLPSKGKPPNQKLTIGRQVGTGSEKFSGKSYTHIWILQGGGAGGSPPSSVPVSPPF